MIYWDFFDKALADLKKGTEKEQTNSQQSAPLHRQDTGSQ